MIDFYEKYKIKSSFQRLEYQYEQHRTKFLEIDIKIPEIFILSSSVVVVYLSTFKELNLPLFFASFCFGVVITSSIVSMWKLKEVHRKIALKVSDALRRFELIERRFNIDKNLECYKSDINILLKEAFEDQSIKNLKKWSDILQIICLGFFLMGLFFTFSIQTWWKVFPKQYKAIMAIIIGILFLIYLSFYIRKNFFPQPTKPKPKKTTNKDSKSSY